MKVRPKLPRHKFNCVSLYGSARRRGALHGVIDLETSERRIRLALSAS